jgi:replicative DNA helicase
MNMSTTLSFNINDTLPPANIEAEESILGGILFDETAIHRIKDRLKPEHFYLDSHKDIYAACLRLAEKGSSTQLPFVVSYLTDNDVLARVGGRNKLAFLLDRTVSTVNTDHLADLVIDKAIRRAVIKVGGEIAGLGYSMDSELSEIMAALERQTRSIIETPSYQTKEEAQRAKHDRLLKELTEINTTCGEPSYRFYKMKDLADKYEVSMKFLEMLYLKSLVSQCSKLLTYEELKQIAGGTVREWLLNGLVPKRTTICLVADGGIGKTKYAYSLSKNLIDGKALGIFQPTGEKRRILFYQGDEPEVDMYQALETLGYSEGDIGTYVRVRVGWSFENMPDLLKDLQEFKPDFAVLDSLSSANRLSIFKEGEMEYARPLLELAGLATKHNCTFLIIHHTNKAGDTRGSTAIRNTVSEFWKLTQPTDPQSTAGDRILEINKSRSRSCGKKYRLFFDSETLNFSFLGEEGAEHSNNSENALKPKILDFFNTNRNQTYTAIEVACQLDSDRGYTRKCLLELKADGLLSVIQTPGQAHQYFLSFEGVHPLTQKNVTDASEKAVLNRGVHPRYTPGTPPGTPPRYTPQTHPPQDFQPKLYPLGEKSITFSEDSSDFEKNANGGTPPLDFSESSDIKGSGGVPGGVPPACGSTPLTPPVGITEDTQPIVTKDTVENICPRTGLPLPQPFEVKIEGPLGTSTAALNFLKVRKDNRIEFRVDFNFANSISSRKRGSIGRGKAEAIEIVTKEINDRINEAIKHPSRRYQVMQIVGSMLDPEVIWVENCICTQTPEHPVNGWYVFINPSGDRIRVAGDNEFRLESANG